MITDIKRILIGNPLATDQMSHERLGKIQALAVLSSDALSSVAYATEEIILMLALAGAGALAVSWPISIGIAILLAIVATSYYQTIHAYPTGGGSYTVSKENLGTIPSLVAGAALLTDYLLTVAVSISAGVAAITSAFPLLFPFKVELALAAVAIVTLVNLRGLRESGRVFSIPTYFFVVMMYLLLGVGLVRWLFGGLTPLPVPSPTELAASRQLGLFLILRAFASGCTAMTGVEAISNGIPVFKKPESTNAGKTLLWMAGILITMFLGTAFLAYKIGIYPVEGQTTVSLIARSVFGGNSPLYYALQIATALILFLAANTSYSDFPRLSMWMAQDRFMPRQLANLGDRLVYANGIMMLGILAGVLIILFNASTNALIPLYAVGVFLSFTLNQSGMVRHWFKLKTPGWQRLAVINGVGAIATFTVLIVMAVTKFTSGAWAIILLIPVMVFIFQAIHAHYLSVAEQLSLNARWPVPAKRHTIVIPVADLHRGVLKAIRYGQSLTGDLKAVTVNVNPEATARLQKRWAEVLPELDLVVIPSPYRSVIQPLTEYVDQFVQQEGDFVTVVLAEFVPVKWWHHLLHNQTGMALKLALLYSRKSWKGRFHIITDVPFYLLH